MYGELAPTRIPAAAVPATAPATADATAIPEVLKSKQAQSSDPRRETVVYIQPSAPSTRLPFVLFGVLNFSRLPAQPDQFLILWWAVEDTHRAGIVSSFAVEEKQEIS